MKKPFTFIWMAATASLLWSGLQFLPDAWIQQVFCRVPLEVTAWWFDAPIDRAEFTYRVGRITFEMARSCAGDSFFSLCAAILLWRSLKWSWVALPLTLVLNTLRAILTATLTLKLRDCPFESLAHLTAGAATFMGALYLVWILTEKRRHGR
jgi:exosortase/archaeosortase family protein